MHSLTPAGDRVRAPGSSPSSEKLPAGRDRVRLRRLAHPQLNDSTVAVRYGLRRNPKSGGYRQLLIYGGVPSVLLTVRVEQQQSQQRDGRGLHRAHRSWHVDMPGRGVVIGVLIVVGLVVASATWRPSANQGPSAALPESSGPAPVPATVQPTVDEPVAEPPLPPAPGPTARAPGPSPAAPPVPAPRTTAPRADPPGPGPRPTVVGPRPETKTLAPARVPEPRAAQVGPLSGTFRVVDTFTDAFIGEVVVANASGAAVNWRVSLLLPDTVTELRTSWVDGTSPPAVSRTGQTVVFTGAQPVPSGATAPLRFQFARTGGVTPLSCTVNDVRCGGAT